MSESRSQEIAKNLEIIKKELGHKAKLVAVSKTWPASDVRLAYQAGQRIFGENKVQELLEKSEELSDLEDLQWHFIGHLQSNKLNMLLKCRNLVSIHSIDSIKLLNKLLKKPIDIDDRPEIFLQMNTSGEKEKGGLEGIYELREAIELINKSESYKLKGLMTIGSIRSDDFEAAAMRSFDELARFRDQIDPNLELSMGMSQDYRIAIEKGSDWVRIGSKIFGSRS